MSSELRSVDGVASCREISADKRECRPSAQLQHLLTFLGLSADSNLQNIVDATQREWTRKKGVERWQMQERFQDKRAPLLDRFREMGFVDAVFSTNKRYDYGVIHGATLQRVRSRIEWLKSEWQKGVRFDAIVVLSGERVLDEELELTEIHKNWRCCEVIPKNEIEMIRWLLKRVQLPEGMRDLPITVVDARASDHRAHTGDTIEDWLKRSPKPGSILAVSNQPFVSYQDMAMRNKMPARFQIETIGEAASEGTMNVVYLDNLARLLFELQKWTQKN